LGPIAAASGAKSCPLPSPPRITTNLAGYQALVAKQADFLWIYMGWDGVQAQLDHVDLNTFLLKDYGVPDYYTPVIIANESFLQDHADAARRFMAATAPGHVPATAQPAPRLRARATPSLRELRIRWLPRLEAISRRHWTVWSEEPLSTITVL